MNKHVKRALISVGSAVGGTILTMLMRRQKEPANPTAHVKDQPQTQPASPTKPSPSPSNPIQPQPRPRNHPRYQPRPQF